MGWKLYNIEKQGDSLSFEIGEVNTGTDDIPVWATSEKMLHPISQIQVHAYKKNASSSGVCNIRLMGNADRNHQNITAFPSPWASEETHTDYLDTFDAIESIIAGS